MRKILSATFGFCRRHEWAQKRTFDTLVKFVGNSESNIRKRRAGKESHRTVPA
jgi:hypothetical protein